MKKKSKNNNTDEKKRRQDFKVRLDYLVSMFENENKTVLEEKRILENKISGYLTFTSIIISFLVGIIVYIYPWGVTSQGSEEFLTIPIWFLIAGVFFWGIATIISALFALYPKKITDLDIEDKAEKILEVECFESFEKSLMDNYKIVIEKNKKLKEKLEIWNVVVIWCIIIMMCFFCFFVLTFLLKSVLHLH